MIHSPIGSPVGSPVGSPLAHPLFGGWTPANLAAIWNPGLVGFGVAPSIHALPDGVFALSGCSSLGHDNWGNYQHIPTGAILCYIPAFFYRIAHASNPTYGDYGVNSVDIKHWGAYSSVAAANADGYALHRAFYDGGKIKAGVFVFKYQASKIAKGTGYTITSLPNTLPLSTNSAHNPIGDITATGGTNNYAACLDAPKGMDDANGAYVSGSRWISAMRYMHDALARLSLAHGQAATSTTYCAWYDASGVTNFPKGNNNNALGDVNDGTISYTSDGYSNCGKTGSGTPFAKTTHNGQACGVADLNGNMWEVSPGVTYVASNKSITGATQTNPVQLTVASHGRTTGDQIMVISVGGMTQINEKLFTVTVIDPDTISLDGCDGTAFGAYTSGGTLTAGTMYALSTSASASDLTSGNSLATDAWGATGVAAHSQAVAPTWRTDYPNNGFDLRHGDGAAQVFDAAITGDAWLRTANGLPLAVGASSGGTNLYGTDQLYQKIVNESCPNVGGHWADAAKAGVNSAIHPFVRSFTIDSVGFRAACYGDEEIFA